MESAMGEGDGVVRAVCLACRRFFWQDPLLVGAATFVSRCSVVRGCMRFVKVLDRRKGAERVVDGCRLFAVFRVDDDGYGTVVDKFHLHVGTEFARRNGALEGVREHFHETFIEGYRNVRSCGFDVTGSVPLLCAGIERELAYYQHVAAVVEDADIHHTIPVVEDAEVDDFLHQPFDVGVCILGVDPQETKDSGADFALNCAADAHAGAADAL